MMKDIGISSAFPLPFGSFVLKAINTSFNSFVVVGIFSPNLFNHSTLIHGKQSTEWILSLPEPNSSIHGKE
ncbi:hypothetical protein D3C84_1250790 [compost metagenome]